MNINHALLYAVGVSHESLERLAYAARNAGAFGAKLTGGGGGGSFGHPMARKYAVKEGYKSPSQSLGFSKTHQAMVALNK